MEAHDRGFVTLQRLIWPNEGVNPKPEEMSDRDWVKLRRKTIGTIRQWVDYKPMGWC